MRASTWPNKTCPTLELAKTCRECVRACLLKKGDQADSVVCANYRFAAMNCATPGQLTMTMRKRSTVCMFKQRAACGNLRQPARHRIKLSSKCELVARAAHARDPCCVTTSDCVQTGQRAACPLASFASAWAVLKPTRFAYNHHFL